MAGGGMEIRSYRVVFDLERRIHRVDRWRLPFPYGLPLRSITYALIGLVLIAVLGRLPVLGAMLAALPAPARLVLAPVGMSYALTRLRVDGRSAHAAALAWLRYILAPRRMQSWRAAPRVGDRVLLPDVTIASDPTTSRVVAGVVRGPASVLLRRPAELTQRGRTLVVRQLDGEAVGEPTRISFEASRRVVLR